MWQGKVDGNSESGKKTPIHLKKGEVITILAEGWIKFGKGDVEWADPQSPIPPFLASYKSDTTGSLGSLVATIGEDKTRYPIGNGKVHWSVPAEGVLTFLFDDQLGKYADNSGSFDVTVTREASAPAPQPKPTTWTLEANNAKGVRTNVTVSPGDVISITATGEATVASGHGMAGPDGDPTNTDKGALLASANVGSLLMQIGDGTPQFVGSKWSGAVKEGGTITFLYNDAPGWYGDDKGSFEITLTKET